MRELVLKYSGECKACGATLEAGTSAIYERRAGVWCVGCAPTDPEAIRAARQEAADRKAAKREEWAESHERKAEAAYRATPESLRRDWAFITQPGHIPERARMIRRDQRGYEHTKAANEHRAKANALRSGVVVAGDRERRREKERELTRQWIRKGMRVSCALWGEGTVKGIYPKSARCVWDRCGKAYSVDLSWLAPMDAAEAKANMQAAEVAR